MERAGKNSAMAMNILDVTSSASQKDQENTSGVMAQCLKGISRRGKDKARASGSNTMAMFFKATLKTISNKASEFTSGPMRTFTLVNTPTT